MKKTNRILLASALILMPFVSVYSQWGRPANLYVERENQPDGGIFLPAPPDTSSVAYIDDFMQWQWGKSMRSTERGERASLESASSTTETARIYSEALGFQISRTETPAIYNLMSRSYHTAEQASKNPKEKYMRIRPVIQYNEITTGRSDRLESLRTSGSYPSGHTTRGMATALVFAEMAPEYQDTILRRGFEYGESRIIVSAHYQSDVNAGYMCAAACVAAMHSVPDFYADMEAARAEYYEKSGRKPDAKTGLPDGRRVVGQPVDTASTRYYGEVAQYCWGMALILTEIAPDHANDILALGYRMGSSGIITGQHWATDISAARIMATGVVARLHADPDFVKLLDEAKKEYAGG